MRIGMLRVKALAAALIAVWAQICIAIALIPATAHAAGETANWTCRVSADGPQPLSITSSDQAALVTDQRTYDLDCRFRQIAPGPSPVTLCLAIPTGDVGGAFPRFLRRSGGSETIAYKLFARPGQVPGAQPAFADERQQALRPVYTVNIDRPIGGVNSFLHQFVITTEIRKNAGVVLPEGSYVETIDGMVASLHDGSDCGPVLWGPNDGGLGAAAQFRTELNVTGSCSVSVSRPLSFGSVTEVTPALRANGAIDVQCPDGVAYTVEMSVGLNADSGSRRMVYPGEKDQFYLPYTILKPDGSEWGSDDKSIPGTPFTGTGDGTIRSIDVVALTPNSIFKLPTGRYEDRVIVIVNH